MKKWLHITIKVPLALFLLVMLGTMQVLLSKISWAESLISLGLQRWIVACAGAAGFLFVVCCISLLVSFVKRIVKTGTKEFALQKKCWCAILCVVLLLGLWGGVLYGANRWDSGAFYSGVVTGQGVDSTGYYLVVQSAEIPAMKLYCTQTESAMAAVGNTYYQIEYVTRPGEQLVGYLSYMRNIDSQVDK